MLFSCTVVRDRLPRRLRPWPRSVRREISRSRPGQGRALELGVPGCDE